jgi:CRISPR-associated protein (TIGR02584 family)
LLAVSGMSPAILTETVWALAHEKPAVIPDEVVVLTTTRGAADIQSQLLDPRDDFAGLSPWSALRRAILGANAQRDPRLQLASPRVIELPDLTTGVKKPASDLRTPDDNTAAADFILEEVRRLTENPDVRILASIAGGRKTMGALLYAAMSLLGRETDRLTHVLVDDPFDSPTLQPRFYFPAQPEALLKSPKGEVFDARQAQISLADVPFVPLRNLFERDLTRRPGSFARLVQEASQKLPIAPPEKIVVHLDQPQITVDDLTIELTPREHVLFILLAQDCQYKLPAYCDHTRAHEAYEQKAKALRDQATDAFHDWRATIPKSTTSEDIRKIISNIRHKLKDAGGGAARLERFLKSSRGVTLELNPATVVFEP